MSRYRSPQLRELTQAVADVQAIRAALPGALVGEVLADPDAETVRDHLGSLRGLLTEGGPLLAVWSGHGHAADGSGLRLLTADAEDVELDGVPAAELMASCARTGASQVLLVLDTCCSGGAVDVTRVASHLLRAQPPESPHVWVGVLAACSPVERARDGLFAHVLLRLLREGPRDPRLRLRWSAQNRRLRGNDLCEALLEEWSSDVPTPAFQGSGSAWFMLPNPLWEEDATVAVVEDLLLAARGGSTVEELSAFTGRRVEVGTVVGWVTARRPGIRVVTGSAGTGKSAIVGRVVSVANPVGRRRLVEQGGPDLGHDDPGEGSVHAHVHARGLTADRMAELIGDQLVAAGVLHASRGRRNAAVLVGELQQRASGAPPVILVDGLDEARGEVFPIVDELLARLAHHATVVVATREVPAPEGPSLLERLSPAGADLDLDDPAVRERGLRDLHDYVVRRLSGADPAMDAEAVAAHFVASLRGEQPFLLARILTAQLRENPVDTSADGWDARLAVSVEQALGTDLQHAGPVAHRALPGGSAPADLARALLAALPWAYGRGFPDEEWVAVAGALAPDLGISRDDLPWVLEQLGRYVVQDGEGGLAVYRLAHQSLTDLLQAPLSASPEEPFDPRASLVASALLDRCETLLGAGLPAEQPSYLSRYVWRHVVDAGPDALASVRGLAGRFPALRHDVALAADAISLRLGSWGRRAEALSPAEEAAGVYRALAADDPAYLPDLADALKNLGVRLSGLGRRDQALAHTQEAADTYRVLAADNPGFVPDLAGALTNLGVQLGRLGRGDEALTATQEAVGAYRALAADNPAFTPYLAHALNNLGIQLGALGRRDQALTATQEAVQAYRALAADNPAFVPHLASALGDLGIHLTELGRRDQALTPTQESVELYRTLAAVNPAFVPNLAYALNRLGVHLSELGRRDEALDPTREAVEAYRALAADSPAFTSDLAGALKNLGARLSALGRREQAVPHTEEAVGLYRAQAPDNPALGPDLAGALSNLGLQLSELGRREQALAASQEAVELYRTLAADNPAVRPDLAVALSGLGVQLADLGRRDEALPPTQQAVDLYRALAADNPAFTPNLAGALSNLGVHLSELGRRDEALACTQEAVDAYRTLAADNPAFVPDLASTLSNLGVHLSELGRSDQALASTQEAVDLYRTLTADNPALVPDLARALTNLGSQLSTPDRSDQALAPTQEAADLYRMLAAEYPFFVGNLAAVLARLETLSDPASDPADPWRAAVDGLPDPVGAALLLMRSRARSDGDPVTAQWLTAAEELAGADGVLVAALHEDARRHHRAGLDAYADAWREAASGEPPDWLSLPPDQLELVRGWLATADFEDERDYLDAHQPLLGEELDGAVEEALLSAPEPEAERYRSLRAAAREVGVTEAYRPVLAQLFAGQLIQADPEKQRDLLTNRRVQLLSDDVSIVIDTMQKQVAANPPPTDQASPDAVQAWDRAATRAQSLLAIARQDLDGAALDALDDPARFPQWLAELVGTVDPEVLRAAATLAWVTAFERGDQALGGVAVVHVAVADALAGRAEDALETMAYARDLAADEEERDGWRDRLVDLAERHPDELLPLVGAMRTPRPAEQSASEEPGDHLGPTP